VKETLSADAHTGLVNLVIWSSGHLGIWLSDYRFFNSQLKQLISNDQMTK